MKFVVGENERNHEENMPKSRAIFLLSHFSRESIKISVLQPLYIKEAPKSQDVGRKVTSE